MYHGFGRYFAHQFTREERLKFFGNCICPPVARAVFMSFVKEGGVHKPLTQPVVSATSPYIDITLVRSLFPAPKVDTIQPPTKLGSASPKPSALITSGWEVGSVPYCLTQKYYDTHPLPRLRVPRPITQAYIYPTAPTAKADFLASVELGVIPLTDEQKFWEVRDGVDGKAGSLLGGATKQFRSIVQDTLLPSFVSAVRRTDSIWSSCWGSFRNEQKELRQSLRDWACSPQRCQSPFGLDPVIPSSDPQIDLSPQYGGAKRSASSIQSLRSPTARAIPQSPRQVALMNYLLNAWAPIARRCHSSRYLSSLFLRPGDYIPRVWTLSVIPKCNLVITRDQTAS